MLFHKNRTAGAAVSPRGLMSSHHVGTDPPGRRADGEEFDHRAVGWPVNISAVGNLRLRDHVKLIGEP